MSTFLYLNLLCIVFNKGYCIPLNSKEMSNTKTTTEEKEMSDTKTTTEESKLPGIWIPGKILKNIFENRRQSLKDVLSFLPEDNIPSAEGDKKKKSNEKENEKSEDDSQESSDKKIVLRNPSSNSDEAKNKKEKGENSDTSPDSSKEAANKGKSKEKRKPYESAAAEDSNEKSSDKDRADSSKDDEKSSDKDRADSSKDNNEKEVEDTAVISERAEEEMRNPEENDKKTTEGRGSIKIRIKKYDKSHVKKKHKTNDVNKTEVNNNGNNKTKSKKTILEMIAEGVKKERKYGRNKYGRDRTVNEGSNYKAKIEFENFKDPRDETFVEITTIYTILGKKQKK